MKWAPTQITGAILLLLITVGALLLAVHHDAAFGVLGQIAATAARMLTG